MRILRRLVAGVVLPAAFLYSASTVGAATCTIPSSFIDVCQMQTDVVESPTNIFEEDSFITPDLPDDSLFARRWYGRLADNANVYASPTRAGAPLHNVGDGYLFATIIRRLQNDGGETWYEINPGEFVHADDIQPTEASDFQGMETTRQPERPFGWVEEEVTPSSMPDGEPDTAFDKLPRYTFVEIYDAVEGQEKSTTISWRTCPTSCTLMIIMALVCTVLTGTIDLVTNTVMVVSTCPS